MPNERDPFWKHVTVIDPKKHIWRCKYCNITFTAKVQRAKAHLAKVTHMDIQACKSPAVPENIILEAKLALESPSGSRKRQRAESNIDSEVFATQLEIGGTSSASLQPITNYLTGSNSNPTPVTGEASSNSSPLEHKMETLERKLRRITHRSAHKREELDQVIYQTEKQLKKLKAIKKEFGTIGQSPNYFLQVETEVEVMTREVDELLIRRGILSESLTIKNEGPEGEAFLLTDPVGEEFEEQMDDIWNCLHGGDISRIGIYGMAGVGKTFLAKHLYNKVYDHESFENVFWVSVSKDDRVGDLQSKIARAVKAVNIFTNEEKEEKRACLLREHLMNIGKYVLILDDVWEEFELEKVGIPIQYDGLKLVLTTRLFNICRKICENHIKIECLHVEKEAWTLFTKHLGHNSLPPGAEVTSGTITSYCGGLPLAIVETTKVIREVVPEQNWPSDLGNLIQFGLKEMDKRIFPILAVSFDRLTFKMQQCFLRCALYQDEVVKSDLIEFFSDERLISRSTSRAMMLKEGNLIIGGLLDACLLEIEDDYLCPLEIEDDDLYMHEVIRRMALNIMATKSMLVVEDFQILRDEKYWRSDLQLARIRNGCGYGGEHPLDGISPKCPELSTLLVYNNDWLIKIPGSFFNHLYGLKVLNLSNTPIEELPNCISELLLCLEALVLRACRKLSGIPSLAKLGSLKKLDLFGCRALKEVPDGLECLVNLQYLDSFRTGIRLQVVVLQKMVKLQYLNIHSVVDVRVEFQLTATVELEYLCCHFEDEKQFYTFMSNFLPSHYDLTIGGVIHRGSFGDESFVRLITIYGDNMREICLLKNVEKLVINSSSTCSLKFLDCFPKEDIDSCTELVMGEEIDIVCPYLGSPKSQSYLYLRELKLCKCAGLKYIFSASTACYLKNLKSLIAEDCVTLEGIVTTAGLQLPDGAFPSLEYICVEGCNQMRTLVGHLLLPHLQKLQRIEILHCINMKEIIESNQHVPSHGQSSQSSSSALPLLGLRSLFLSHLPKLELVYDDWRQPIHIVVISCPKVMKSTPPQHMSRPFL